MSEREPGWISPEARLAADVETEPGAVVGAGVRVGARTRLHACTVLEGPLEIGEDNEIGPTASLGSAPQDLKYDGEPTRAEVGDRNRIREFVTLNRGTRGGGGVTSLGSDNLLMAYAHVAHDCSVGDHVVMANAATLGGHVEVGDWSVVGAFSSVHPFCRVGEHSYIGGYCVLTRDVPPFLRVVGQRGEARTLDVNSVGLARRGFGEDTIRSLKRAYRIFRREGRLDRLLDEIMEAEGGCSEVRRLVDFCRESERGVIR